MSDIPLATAELPPPDPALIQELFDADPMSLSDQDIDIIVASFRADRVSYLQTEPEKRTKGKPAKPSASRQAEIPLGDISLDDLLS